MSTLRTAKGRTVAQVARSVQRRHEWVSKIARNRRLLARLSSIIVLANGWDTPPKSGQPNRLKLDYVGTGTTSNEAAADIARIQKTLNCTLDANNTATVKLGRMTVELTVNFPFSRVRRAA